MRSIAHEGNQQGPCRPTRPVGDLAERWKFANQGKQVTFHWKRMQQWPRPQGTTVYNFGTFEPVWCQSGRCM